MKVFIDTNVILDYFMHREEHDVVEMLFQNLRRRDAQMFVSVGGFYTIHYIVHRFLRKEKGFFGETLIVNLRNILLQILHLFTIAEHDNESLISGVSDSKYTDLEDSCQYQLALKNGCEALITLNVSDYPVKPDNPVKILTPQDFMILIDV